MNFKYLLLICFFLLFLAGCAPQRLQLSHSQFETLNIRLELNPYVDPGVQAVFKEELELYIAAYNSRAPLFYLANNDFQSEATLTIHIAENKLVSQNEQVVGVVASVVGLSLPFIMVSAGSLIYVFSTTFLKMYQWPIFRSLTTLTPYLKVL